MGAKAKYDIAPLIRNGFKEGLGIYARRQGKTIPEVFADWISEDFKAVLNAVGKYTIREQHVSGKVDHEHEHHHSGDVSISHTDALIAEVAEADALQPPPKPVSH